MKLKVTITIKIGRYENISNILSNEISNTVTIMILMALYGIQKTVHRIIKINEFSNDTELY